MARRTAEEYLETLAPERCNVELKMVDQGHEPMAFSETFFGWQSWQNGRNESSLRRPLFLGTIVSGQQTSTAEGQQTSTAETIPAAVPIDYA